MNGRIKSLERKERLTDEDVAFLQEAEREDKKKLEAMKLENKTKLTALIKSNLGESWNLSWDGSPFECAYINLLHTSTMRGDFLIIPNGKGTLLKVGDWDIGNPETSQDLKERADALQFIMRHWDKFKSFFAQNKFKTINDELYSCGWQLEAEHTERMGEIEDEAVNRATMAIKKGTRFTNVGAEECEWEILKVDPRVVRLKEFRNGKPTGEDVLWPIDKLLDRLVQGQCRVI